MPYKGLFWLIDEKLISVKTLCDTDGNALEEVAFSSKSGENYNHAAEWAKLPSKTTQGHPYNFYPRGRVEIKNQCAVIYLNPALNSVEMQADIIAHFALESMPKVRFKSDGSAHYSALCFTDKSLLQPRITCANIL